MSPERLMEKLADAMDEIRWLRAAVAAERDACAQIALTIETEGHTDLYGDPDMPTPITNAIRARGKA